MKEATVVDKVTYLLKTIATNIKGIKSIQETKIVVNDELFISTSTVTAI